MAEPPQDYPPPTASAGVDFPPSPTASPCGFGLALPRFKFGFNLNLPFSFPPAIPGFFFAFKLTCDLSHPVDISGGLNLPFGGGRSFNSAPDPDDSPDN